MRVVVLGAGAVGGTIAARLSDAGTEVLALARGDHAAAVRADGLRLDGPDGPVTARMDVVDHPSDLPLLREGTSPEARGHVRSQA